MAKRSTNFNPRRPKTTTADLVSLAEWLGMTDEEIRAMAQRHAARVTARGEPIRDDRPLPMNGTDYHLDVPFSTVARRTPHEGSDGNT